MTGYNPEWRKEDEQRVKDLDLWYKLDGRDKDHPNRGTYTGLYQERLIYRKWAERSAFFDF